MIQNYIVVGALIFCSMNLSVSFVGSLRSSVIGIVTPLWRSLSTIGCDKGEALKQQLLSLKAENSRLKSQLNSFSRYLDLTDRIVQETVESEISPSTGPNWISKRREEVARLLELHAEGITARLIFQEPGSWSSSFWIDLGEKSHPSHPLIVKNSAVVLGNTLVGVVEYVDAYKSLVRSITHFPVAVRALRGGEEKISLALQLRRLFHFIENCSEDLETESIRLAIREFYQQLEAHCPTFYLAKGELNGFRKPGSYFNLPTLYGRGFNPDFEDEKGGEGDQKGERYFGEGIPEVNQISLIKRGDILVTTGLEGYFPEGLRVGQVSKVYPLNQGAPSYELEVIPFIERLNEMPFVTVLPPKEFGDLVNGLTR